MRACTHAKRVRTNRKHYDSPFYTTAGNTMEKNTLQSEVENTTSNNTHNMSNTGIGFSEADITAGVTHMVAPGPIDSASTYYKINYHDSPTQASLIEYLSRPFAVTSGNFISGSFAPITILNTPGDFIATATPNISGAYGFRATVCYRAEIAAAPQAQGILRLVYEYMPYNAALSKGSYRPISAQLPGAEVNLRDGSAVEIKIPFVSDRDFWPWSNGTYTKNNTAFRVSLFPYAPVAWDTTTVSTPSYVLYRWFEDVELIGKSTPTVAVTPQAGRNPEADVPKVSTWFKYGNKIATYAATIPTLTSLALPVSWAFDAAAKIAAHYGWSKPNNGSYMGVVHRSWARGINTCVDSDIANPMGYYSNNQVQIMPGFAGSDIDEMALCYLTCKPGLIASCQLRAADARGSVKWVTPVAPSCFVFQSSSTGFAQLSAIGLGSTAVSGNKPGYFPSPLAYCASFFERWRGNVIFRFKFNTTKFHAGKLLIGYVPGEDVSDGVTSGGFSQAPNAALRYDFESVIIDLRTTTEYDFLVPFTYPAAWNDTGMINNNTGVFGVPNIGSVFVRIIDPLYGPDNVMQNVDMLVEVLSDCGLELSQPIKSIMMPLDMSTSQIVVAQAGRDTGGSDACLYASGERVLSVKQIAARPIWYDYPDNNVYGIEPTANLAYYPQTVFIANAGSYNIPAILADSILNRVGCMYALCRGSIVFRSLPKLSLDSTNGVKKSDAFSVYNWAPALAGDISNAAFSLEGDGATHIHIPYYGKNTRMRTAYNIKPSGSNYSPDGTTRTLWGGWNSTPNDIVNTYEIRGVCAGDDLQFGAFTGVPACVTAEPFNIKSNQDLVMRRY